MSKGILKFSYFHTHTKKKTGEIFEGKAERAPLLCFGFAFSSGFACALVRFARFARGSPDPGIISAPIYVIGAS